MSDRPWESRCCDLVMKGGIASGIVYPSAIARISKDFSFIGIGGTSAGAIAASVAAAAEYQRRHTGSNAGYEYLSTLPDQLGDGRLLNLFRPDTETAKLYRFLSKGVSLKDRNWFSRNQWKLSGLWKLYRSDKTLRPAIKNGYGLCTGMANGVWKESDSATDQTPPLMIWLCDVIDHAAGNTSGTPLTFGDLHSAPIPGPLQGMFQEGARSIDFRAVTTCMTFGRPYEFPWETKRFAFDPKEWSQIFPKRVMDHLIRTAQEIDSPSRKKDGKLPLPEAKDLPILVAVRMSLSFPGLFTMIPLYAVNYELDDQPLQRVWFTDGGVTSNFPMHRFDALFPRWPTLGINLKYTDKDDQPGRRGVDPSKLVYIAKSRKEGIQELRHEISSPETKSGSAFLGFGMGLFRSAQIWHDHGFLRLPAYRDRSVEIWLSSKEGGLNLNMGSDTIDRLRDRGELAGQLICERFNDSGSTEQMDWPAHRWARYRSGMEGLFNYLQKFEYGVAHPMPIDPALPELLTRDSDSMPCYAFDTNDQHQAAGRMTQLLLDLIRSAGDDNGHPFAEGPRPTASVGTRVPM